MTDGERKLRREWREFRRLYGIHMRRQAPIGPYVVDFVTHEHHPVIEVDGERHVTPSGQARDQVRDAWLASQGYRVLSLTTGELAETFDGCVEELLGALGLMNEPTGTLSPTPQRAKECELRL